MNKYGVEIIKHFGKKKGPLKCIYLCYLWYLIINYGYLIAIGKLAVTLSILYLYYFLRINKKETN